MIAKVPGIDSGSQRLAAMQCDMRPLNQERDQGTKKQFFSSETDTTLSSQAIAGGRKSKLDASPLLTGVSAKLQ